MSDKAAIDRFRQFERADADRHAGKAASRRTQKTDKQTRRSANDGGARRREAPLREPKIMRHAGERGRRRAPQHHDDDTSSVSHDISESLDIVSTNDDVSEVTSEAVACDDAADTVSDDIAESFSETGSSFIDEDIAEEASAGASKSVSPLHRAAPANSSSSTRADRSRLHRSRVQKGREPTVPSGTGAADALALPKQEPRPAASPYDAGTPTPRTTSSTASLNDLDLKLKFAAMKVDTSRKEAHQQELRLKRESVKELLAQRRKMEELHLQNHSIRQELREDLEEVLRPLPKLPSKSPVRASAPAQPPIQAAQSQKPRNPEAPLAAANAKASAPAASAKASISEDIASEYDASNADSIAEDIQISAALDNGDDSIAESLPMDHVANDKSVSSSINESLRRASDDVSSIAEALPSAISRENGSVAAPNASEHGQSAPTDAYSFDDVSSIHGPPLVPQHAALADYETPYPVRAPEQQPGLSGTRQEPSGSIDFAGQSHRQADSESQHSSFISESQASFNGEFRLFFKSVCADSPCLPVHREAAKDAIAEGEKRVAALKKQIAQRQIELQEKARRQQELLAQKIQKQEMALQRKLKLPAPIAASVAQVEFDYDDESFAELSIKENISSAAPGLASSTSLALEPQAAIQAPSNIGRRAESETEAPPQIATSAPHDEISEIDEDIPADSDSVADTDEPPLPASPQTREAVEIATPDSVAPVATAQDSHASISEDIVEDVPGDDTDGAGDKSQEPDEDRSALQQPSPAAKPEEDLASLLDSLSEISGLAPPAIPATSHSPAADVAAVAAPLTLPIDTADAETREAPIDEAGGAYDSDSFPEHIHELSEPSDQPSLAEERTKYSQETIDAVAAMIFEDLVQSSLANARSTTTAKTEAVANIMSALRPDASDAHSHHIEPPSPGLPTASPAVANVNNEKPKATEHETAKSETAEVKAAMDAQPKLPLDPSPPAPTSADGIGSMVDQLLLLADPPPPGLSGYAQPPFLSEAVLDQIQDTEDPVLRDVGLLVFEATNEAIAMQFKAHQAYEHPLRPLIRQQSLRPRPVPAHALFSAVRKAVVDEWAGYSDIHQENLDALLIREVKESEKAWRSTDLVEAQIKLEIEAQLWDSLLEDTAVTVDRVLPKPEWRL
nr:hypothetical protein HK105_005270 [Polyrhizophydium stewartii]